jgi:hypothetical protein
MSRKYHVKKNLFLDRPHFMVLFDNILYRCKTILKCKKYLQCGKTWSISLIWQHCSGETQTYCLYLHKDGVIDADCYGDLSFFQCFYAYMRQFYGTCYAENKSRIYKYFLTYHIYLDISVLRLIIYIF